MKRIALLSALALSLAGCKVWTAANLFTRDLIEVYETGDDLTTPMVMAFEIGSKSECDNTTKAISEALKESYGAVETLGCDQKGFDIVARFRVPVEIVHEVVNEKSDSDQPIYIGVYADEPEKLTVSFFRNSEAMDQFTNQIPEEITRFSSGDVEPFLSATLQNDMKSDVQITLRDVFADGDPIPAHTTKDMSLKRRDQVEIYLSDVANSAFLKTWAYVPIATIHIGDDQASQ